MSTHVFLTRFNLPANRVEQSIFSEQWLLERVELFQRFTVPSVRAQRDTTPGEAPVSTRWLIFLDHTSPAWLRDLMAGLEAEGLASPRYLDGPLEPSQLRVFIRAALGSPARPASSGTVITSNLDNDDGLAHNFVSRTAALAQDAAARGDLPATLSLTTGLVHHGREVYLHDDANNAFSSVVDDLAREDLATCWDEWHNRLAQLMPASRSDGEPAWLQVVHGRNVSNRVRGRVSDPRLHASTFPGLLDDLTAPARAAVLRDTFMRRPVRAIRDGLRGPVAHAARSVLGAGTFERAKSAVLRRR